MLIPKIAFARMPAYIFVNFFYSILGKPTRTRDGHDVRSCKVLWKEFELIWDAIHDPVAPSLIATPA